MKSGMLLRDAEGSPRNPIKDNWDLLGSIRLYFGLIGSRPPPVAKVPLGYRILGDGSQLRHPGPGRRLFGFGVDLK